MKILCTICMRGGSKGVPNKNLRKLDGKPLMAFTIEHALKSDLFEHIVISTDSEKVASTAKNLGAEVWFLRPAEFSTDEAPKIPAIRHAFLESEKHYGQQFDILVDLDVTSPLRKVEDINKAYQQFIDEDADILITANPARKNPYYNMIEKVNGRIQIVNHQKNVLKRRQDAPEVYEMNSSIYIWNRKALLNNDILFTDNTSLYIMPEERSVDIDTELDWNLVQYLIGKTKNGNFT